MIHLAELSTKVYILWSNWSKLPPGWLLIKYDLWVFYKDDCSIRVHILLKFVCNT